MTDFVKLLEDAKCEIRSLLLTDPKGIPLNKFCKIFYEMTGKNVPYKELGYNDSETFLRSIPDVVRMNWSAVYNSLLLTGIADESTKHIEKLVSKQKVTKSKLPRNPRYSYGFVPPPRFKSLPTAFLPANVKVHVIQLMKEYPDGIGLTLFLQAYKQKYHYELKHEEFGFKCLEDCLKTVPGVYLQKRNSEARIYIQCERSSSTPSFSSSEKNFNDFMEPVAKTEITLPRAFSVSQSCVLRTEAEGASVIKTKEDKEIDLFDDFSSSPEHSLELDASGISAKMKQNFIEILKQHPSGIWAADFCDAYKTYTGCKLDLTEIGYYSLTELVDALPEIFVRNRPLECKSDWLLYLKGSVPPDIISKAGNRNVNFGPSYIERVVQNIRKILQGNVEGIFFDDFILVYCMNCEEPLDLNQLGFGNLENFLLNIQDRIPLKLDYSSVRKKVLLAGARPSSPIFQAVSGFKSGVPSDAVLPGAEYEFQTIAPDVDTNKFIPMYIGTVVDPSLFWIQLKGRNTSVALDRLMDELQEFYDGSQGDLYRMKEQHILVNTVCIGPWSGRTGGVNTTETPYGQWHRIHIIGMSDVNFVDAAFVDYGTREKVPKSSLRYLRQEFFKLPAQAIKSRLAFIRPLNGTNWDERVRRRILNMCANIPLMGQIIKLPQYPRFLSLWLCDTNGDDDIHINKQLVNEGYAVWFDENSTEQFANDPRVPAFDAWNMGAVNQTELLKAVSIILQAAASSPLPGSQTLIENLLHILNPMNRSQSNAAVMQQLLSSGIDRTTLLNALSSSANPLSSHNLPSYCHPNYSQLLNSKPLYPNMGYGNINSRPAAPPNVQQNAAFAPFNYPYVPTNTAVKSNICIPSVNTMPMDPRISTARTVSVPPGMESTINVKPVNIENEKISLNSTRFVENTAGEIFDDDDDAFDNYCEQLGSSVQRYVKRLKLKDGYRIHIIAMGQKLYMSSGDISHLFWRNEDSNCLSRRLRGKDIVIATVTLVESECPHIFEQLKRFRVKGIKTHDGVLTVVLYPLKNVIDILNIFGHPSPTIREEIEKEISSYNPFDDLWKDLSDLEIEDEEEIIGETDNDKLKTIQKMCVYDLKASLEGLRFKRLKIMNDSLNSENVSDLKEEMKKIEVQSKMLEKRIKEIEDMCTTYKSKAD